MLLLSVVRYPVYNMLRQCRKLGILYKTTGVFYIPNHQNLAGDLKCTIIFRILFIKNYELKKQMSA